MPAIVGTVETLDPITVKVTQDADNGTTAIGSVVTVLNPGSKPLRIGATVIAVQKPQGWSIRHAEA